MLQKWFDSDCLAQESEVEQVSPTNFDVFLNVVLRSFADFTV